MAFTQTVDQVVSDTYLKATGKGGGVSFGTAKYIKILQMMNFYTRQWANIEEQWHSLRELFTLGVTVTATDTFALLASIDYISQQEGDFVRIYHTDGVHESDYSTVPIEKLYADGPIVLGSGINRRNAVGTCAQVGQTLVFSRPFQTTDPQFGGSIQVPGQAIPAILVNATDTVQVDDPTWLSCRCAADYVRTDVTRSQLFPGLIEEANEIMDTMIERNQEQIEEIYTGDWQPLGMNWDC